MTDKNLVAEENSSDKIETVSLMDFVKPLFEAGQQEKAVVKTTAGAFFAGQLDPEHEFETLERDIKVLKKELGFVFDPEKSIIEIKALIKGKKLPLNSFFGLKDFVETFADTHYSSFKVVNKLFVDLLGDSYPQAVANGYQQSSSGKESMLVQCPKYLIEVIKAGGTVEDFIQMVQKRGYTSSTDAGDLKPHRVMANVNSEVNAFKKAQDYYKALGGDLLEKGFSK